MAEIISPMLIQADPDGKATIEVTGHGIGGYIWTADVIDGNGKVTSLAGAANAPGIGGGVTLTFLVSDIGEAGCHVGLKYHRPWENRAEIEKTVTITSK